MANEFKIKSGLIDLSINTSEIVVTDINKKLVGSGKNFNDVGTGVNDIWSASKIISAIGAGGGTDVLTYKGAIDASLNPNYPAADAGDTYKISVSGKIGGASGAVVEAGDMIICTTDGTVAGTQAAVGTFWNIIQHNIDGAVTGPTTSIDGTIPVFDGVNGNVIRESAVTIGQYGSIDIPLGEQYLIDGVALSKSDIGLSNVTNDAQVKKIGVATDNAIVRWDNTSGDLVQNSTVTIDDSGRINNIPTSIGTSTTITADSFATSLTTAVEWTLVCENGTSDSLIEKLMVWHDGVNPYYNEYSVINKGTGLTDLVVTVDILTGTTLRLRLQNTSGTKSYNVRVSRVLL